jgi:hypothetical protein
MPAPAGSDRSAVAATPSPPKGKPAGRVRAGPVLAAAACVAALHLTNPLAWGAFPGLWAPAAGGVDPAQAAAAVAEGLLGGTEVIAAWWAYRRLGRGARDLGDPRSAVLFVLLVPGLAAGLFAPAHALLAPGGDFAARLVACWLARALGLLAVAPALLTATPALVRRGLVPPGRRAAADDDEAGGEERTRGDAVELAGLALAAGLLSLALAAAGPGLAAWQPWGAPLLLVVWAGLRQGRGAGPSPPPRPPPCRCWPRGRRRPPPSSRRSCWPCAAPAC